MPLKITITGNELEEFIRVDPGNDANVISMLLEMAKNEAEMFLNTDFSETVTNEDGSITTKEIESPAPVKAWVFNRVAQLYENRGFSKETGRETRFVSAQGIDYTFIQPYRVYPFKG